MLCAVVFRRPITLEEISTESIRHVRLEELQGMAARGVTLKVAPWMNRGCASSQWPILHQNKQASKTRTRMLETWLLFEILQEKHCFFPVKTDRNTLKNHQKLMGYGFLLVFGLSRRLPPDPGPHPWPPKRGLRGTASTTERRWRRCQRGSHGEAERAPWKHRRNGSGGVFSRKSCFFFFCEKPGEFFFLPY